MKRYPLTYAAMCMAGLENDEVFRDNLDSFSDEMEIEYLSLYQYQQIRDLYPLFSAICHELAQSFVADEEHCRIGLAGHWRDNPFNISKPYEVWFPKEAYLSWWTQKPRGMTVPMWFSDLAQEPNKDAEITVIQPKPEVLNDQTIVDGLTVADVRAICERSKALASVLRAAVEWQRIADKNSDKKAEGVLRRCLKEAAKNDGWGSALRGEISPNQSNLFVKLITDSFRSGGRPPKKAND